MSNQMNSLIERGLKPVSVLAATREHGDRLKYMAGCRCADCRRANTQYEKTRAAARKAGDWNGIVPASRARLHMLKLSRQGVGRRAVQAVTDIADSILHRIRTGTKPRIRARTERLILAVTKEMASDRALVPAASTWKLISRLVQKGYTEAQIAKLLGYVNSVLQFGKDQITVRNAYEVRRLYEQCEARNFKDATSRNQELPSGTYSHKPGVLIHRMGDK